MMIETIKLPFLEEKEVIEENVEKYLNKDVNSALEITRSLIKEHNLESSEYTTGKPKIYPMVCLVLDTYLNKGYELKKVGNKDRIYRKQIN